MTALPPLVEATIKTLRERVGLTPDQEDTVLEILDSQDPKRLSRWLLVEIDPGFALAQGVPGWTVVERASDADLRTLQRMLDTGVARSVMPLATFVIHLEEHLQDLERAGVIRPAKPH